MWGAFDLQRAGLISGQQAGRASRAVRAIVATLLGSVLLVVVAGPSSAATQEFTLSRAPWPTAEVLSRCHAVVETQQAGYEGFTAVASISGDTLRFAMTADAVFPRVTLEAKLCTWIDADGDSAIDPAEEPTVIASTGTYPWAEGARDAVATARLDAGGGRVCSRMWFYATYADGSLGTKRSPIACTDRFVVPPASVPDASYVVLLGLTGGLLLAGATLKVRRERPV